MSWTCEDELSAIERFDGLTEIDTSGAVTVICVAAVTDPTEAVIVVVPTLNAFTIPALPAALLIVATEGEEEFQITAGSVPTTAPKA